MIDLKGPYDVLNKAIEARDQQAAEIAALLSEGTDEAVTQALALRVTLDALQADLDGKKALYDKLVNVNTPSETARMFVPTTPTAEGEEKPQAMTLAEYNNLTPQERLAYAKSGGKITQ